MTDRRINELKPSEGSASRGTEYSERSSRISGFYRLSRMERIEAIARFAQLNISDLAVLHDPEGLPVEVADCMSENVVGRFGLPLGFATNFRIDGRDYVVPMVIEESSVVAAASFAARLLRGGDGIVSEATDPIMIGQIHFPDPPPEPLLEDVVSANQDALREHLNRNHPRLVAAGGGFRSARVRRLVDPDGRSFAVVHLHVDVRDAMGANAVNAMAEEAAPLLSKWTGSRIGLRILSNLATHRRVRVTGRVQLAPGGGISAMDPAEAARVEEASRFAESDPYRAVTANKGVMNGIDAVLLATGQDFRAVEAAAHAFASYGGRYTALTVWRVGNGILEGSMEIPLALGTVGGITKVHPAVRASLKILGVESARELAEVVAAVGLAQNLAATRALASEGIQQGHMRLHAKNFALGAGAGTGEVEAVVAKMRALGRTDQGAAQDCLKELRSESDTSSDEAISTAKTPGS